MVALTSLYPLMLPGIMVIVASAVAKQQHQLLVLAAALYTCVIGFLAADRWLFKGAYVILAIGITLGWVRQRARRHPVVQR